MQELEKLRRQEIDILVAKKVLPPDHEAVHVEISDVSLRVSVKGGGCSGFSYDMRFVKHKAFGDHVVEDFDGFKVVVDQTSLLYLQGTMIDYTEGLDGRGFVFHNPNTTGRCGCGSSFSV